MVAANRERLRLVRADQQAAGFGRTRLDHRRELQEDYVELIADLIAATGEARVVDLAGRLGVTSATVVTTIGRLQRDGLVTSEPYRSIFLTEAGRELAERSKRRHRIVLEFLHVIGIDPQIAASDAEGIEHHVSEDTLRALDRLTERLRADRGPGS